jgi:MYXO-CTERM domain-containing protein
MSVVVWPGDRAIAALMAFEAATIAVAASLHFAGLGVGSGAAVPETVICVVLAAGAAALVRLSSRARLQAALAVGFAIAGFGVGLSFTAADGAPSDVAYHAAMLPLLGFTLAAVLRRRWSADQQRE